MWLGRMFTSVLPVKGSPTTSQTRKMGWSSAATGPTPARPAPSGPAAPPARSAGSPDGSEHILEAVQRRLDEHPDKMRQRRETVERPFGTIKARMGATHFLTKTLPRVAAEMANGKTDQTQQNYPARQLIHAAPWRCFRPRRFHTTKTRSGSR